MSSPSAPGKVSPLRQTPMIPHNSFKRSGASPATRIFSEAWVRRQPRLRPSTTETRNSPNWWKSSPRWPKSDARSFPVPADLRAPLAGGRGYGSCESYYLLIIYSLLKDESTTGPCKFSGIRSHFALWCLGCVGQQRRLSLSRRLCVDLGAGTQTGIVSVNVWPSRPG